MKIMATSFQGSQAGTAALSAPDRAAVHCRPTPPPGTPRDTHGQAWVSPLWGPCSFLPGPGVHKVLLVPSKSLFPQSRVSSVIKSHWPPQIPWGFSVPLPDPQVGKSVVGPRTSLTVREFLCYDCSAVCGSSAQPLYGLG